jgi:hypothetical protein
VRGTRRVVRAGGLTLILRDTGKELYPLCTMTSNNADCEKGWLYLYNDDVGLSSYTGKVLMGKTDAWFHDVSPPSGGHWGGVASIIANFHHQRIIPSWRGSSTSSR